MRLNPDCIRDVLIAVEENTDTQNVFSFSSAMQFKPPLDKYDYNTILYHIRQCNLAGLLINLREYDCGDSGIIVDLSPSGHEFLANTRTGNVWNKLKEKGIASIPFLLQFAKDFALAYYQGTLQ